MRLKNFNVAWHGMRVESFFSDYNASDLSRRVFIEVDWTSAVAGKIAVDRDRFVLSENGFKAWQEFEAKVRSLFDGFLKQYADSPYHALNCHVTGFGSVSTTNFCWIRSESDQACWASVQPLAREQVATFLLRILSQVGKNPGAGHNPLYISSAVDQSWYPLYLWREVQANSCLIGLAADGLAIHIAHDTILQYLPDPGLEWTLVRADQPA